LSPDGIRFRSYNGLAKGTQQPQVPLAAQTTGFEAGHVGQQAAYHGHQENPQKAEPPGASQRPSRQQKWNCGNGKTELMGKYVKEQDGISRIKKVVMHQWLILLWLVGLQRQVESI